MNKPIDLPLLRDNELWPDHLHNEATRFDSASESKRHSDGARVGISRPH